MERYPSDGLGQAPFLWSMGGGRSTPVCGNTYPMLNDDWRNTLTLLETDIHMESLKAVDRPFLYDSVDAASRKWAAVDAKQKKSSLDCFFLFIGSFNVEQRPSVSSSISVATKNISPSRISVIAIPWYDCPILLRVLLKGANHCCSPEGRILNPAVIYSVRSTRA
jgi:hypothetical protein